MENIFVRKEKKVVNEVLIVCKDRVKVVEKVVKEMGECYEKVMDQSKLLRSEINNMVDNLV